MLALFASQPRGEFDQLQQQYHAAKEQDHSYSSLWPRSLNMDQNGSKALLAVLQLGLFPNLP
jgi:hypothetical protein